MRGKQLLRFLMILLITFAGISLLNQGIVHADGGFDVPAVNDEFDPFEQKAPVQEEQPVPSPPAEKKEGFLDSITEPFSKAWKWTTEKISGAWEWTKEKASAFWDWFTEICSKIAEVVIDALSAAWDWVAKYKEYIAFSIALLASIVLCFFPPVSGLGAAILWGMGISFLVSVGLNGGINENTFLEAAIGGLLGIFGLGIAGGVSKGLATGAGQRLIMGVKNSRISGPVLRGGQKLVSRLPSPLQKIFTKAGFISSVEGTGTTIADDLLHGRKINWKNAILAGFFGAGAVGFVHFAQPVVNKAFGSLELVLARTPIVKNLITKVDDCVAVRQTGGYHAFFLAVNPNCIDTGITDVLKSDLKKWREKVSTDKHTIAVGRTDIEGLEGEVFEGASPGVIKAASKEAGLESLDIKYPNRTIKAPYRSPRLTRHAEEYLMAEFEEAVKKAELNPKAVYGKLYIHQSNPRGACPACIAGIKNSKAGKGIFFQFSKIYPNLEIIVTSEIVEGKRAVGKQFFVLKNGKYIE